jgi:AcrR family transcriptional regulator
MLTDNKQIWIITGYEIFSKEGYVGLKIERLSKKVGISKSSFYHHFADLDFFIELLLLHHIDLSYIIAEKERNSKNINPELIQVLVEHRTDLLFNRQLRISQNNKIYAETLVKSNKIVGDAFKMAWVKDLNLKLTQKQLEGVFTLALENFFLQINYDNLNEVWLTEYFDNLKKITNSFI